MLVKLTTVVTLLVASSSASVFLAPQFRDFLRDALHTRLWFVLPHGRVFNIDRKKKTYGEGVAANLSRGDLEWGASFGGSGRDRKHPTLLNPVILVHGIQNRAGTFIKTIRALRQWGYEDDEIYATTWGAGGKEPLIDVTLSCEHVRHIRQFIIAVVRYTKSKVDIIGYSMGSPLARKAILGGECVDTKERLGKTITHKIGTFLSVAGANHGAQVCLPAPTGVCNRITGLFCGSQFMKDINSRSGYEGSEILSLYTKKDEWIGTNSVCKTKPYSFAGARDVEVNAINHDDLCIKRADVQIEHITAKYEGSRE